MMALVKFRNAGFSMVEIVLAMLVFSVGILAVFALFPEGLKANKRSIDDTQMGLFAEEALNGFLALATVKPWGTWGGQTVTGVAPGMWNNPVSISVTGNTTDTNKYEAIFLPDLIDYAVRYDMVINDVINHADRKYLRLEVRHGEFGPADPTNEPFAIFYTEVYYTGI